MKKSLKHLPLLAGLERIVRGVLLLMAASCAVATGNAGDGLNFKGELQASQVYFENADSEMKHEAEKIVCQAEKFFAEITRKSIANVSIRIRFVSHLEWNGSDSHGGAHLQAVTRQASSGPVIEIASDHTASWERILAHEVTHVFVHHVYGDSSNATLNEGLAEYIAERLFPYEVRAELRRAALPWLSRSVRRYWEGHNFCQKHAKDPHFADFFAGQIKQEDASLEELLHRWDLSKSQIQTLVAKR